MPRPDGHILDIGANTGVYALAAASLSPGATVIAFEPVARMPAQLRANNALNGDQVVVVEQASLTTVAS